MSDTWKSKGIYDLIQLLRYGLPYCQNMMVSSFYFWESTTNTFQLPCGMVTPTLFDIATIIGLRPTGENFDPNESDKDTINFNINCAIFGKYIEDYHVTNIDEIFDEEHITFLALWLSRFIFCCKSLKVAKRYLTLVNQLHKGHDIFLSQLILGSLYKSLGLATEFLKNLKPNDNLLLDGPYLLLQLWLNSMFELSLDVEKSNGADETIKNRRVEGTRLA